MGNPQTFDIIVGVIFLFFLAAGIGFGIRKMLILFLTFYAPGPLLLLALYLAKRLDLQPAASNMVLIGFALAIIALMLVLTIMFRMRGARSASSRVLGAAFAAVRLLQHQVFGLSTPDPIAFAGATLALMVVAFAAIWTPARRALRTDPIAAMRGD